MKYPQVSPHPRCTRPNLQLLHKTTIAGVCFEETFKLNIYSYIKPSYLSKKKRSQYWRRKHLYNWFYYFTALTNWAADYRSAKRAYSDALASTLGAGHYLLFPQPHATPLRPDFNLTLGSARATAASRHRYLSLGVGPAMRAGLRVTAEPHLLPKNPTLKAGLVLWFLGRQLYVPQPLPAHQTLIPRTLTLLYALVTGLIGALYRCQVRLMLSVIRQC